MLCSVYTTGLQGDFRAKLIRVNSFSGASRRGRGDVIRGKRGCMSLLRGEGEG